MKGTAVRLFRGLAHSYDLTVDYATLFQDRYWKRWAAEEMPLAKGGLILDLGCGTLLFEERQGGPKCRFVGLDLSDEMVRLGQAKGLANVSLLVNGDAETLPFQNETFDSVVSCFVPKYVRVDRLAEELSRVTKTGGMVVIYDFAKPRGILAPFIEVYIQGGLRAAGLMLGLARRKEAVTFRELPRIVDKTVWDSGAVGAMEGWGFETLAAKKLTGGVVFAYCGRRRKSQGEEGLDIHTGLRSASGP
jgi:demethylmenaquinone methyltransferase / 2-methoxy-6-polyprenyl-1,4-benzoquinol methylase